MNKDFQKLIIRLQDEGISQYGITLLEGFAIDLENKIEIAKKSAKCNSCEKEINDNSHLTFCTECSGYSNHVSDKMNDFAFAQLNELCQMVDRGCKPVALMTVRVAEYQKAIDIIYNEYTLHAIGKQLNDSFFSVFIFKERNKIVNR